MQIGVYQCIDGASLDPVGDDHGSRRVARHRLMICRHEFRRPGQAGQRNLRASLAAKIKSRLAMAIDITVNVLRLFHCSTTSHSLSPLVSTATFLAVDLVTTTILPSGSTSNRATSIPAFAACLATLASVGFRIRLRSLRVFVSQGSSNGKLASGGIRVRIATLYRYGLFQREKH